MVDHQDYTSRQRISCVNGKVAEINLRLPSTRIAVLYRNNSGFTFFPVIGFYLDDINFHTDAAIVKECDIKRELYDSNSVSKDDSSLSQDFWKIWGSNRKITSTQSPKFYVCDSCNEVIDTFDRLKLHIKRHVTDPCSENDELNLNEVGTYAEEYYVCEVCGGTFFRKFRYNLHVQFCHKKKELLYPCNICGQVFKSASTLDYHKRFHEKNTCNDCGLSFASKVILEDHVKKDHPDSKQFNCETCGANFMSSYELKKHEMTHINEKSFCFDCFNAFGNCTDLKSHTCLPACNKCGMKFKDSAQLETHKNECQENLLKCNSCDKTFQFTASLKEHICNLPADVIHCTLCKKVFVNNDKLSEHLKDHVTCEVCGKLVKTKFHLKSHMFTHTNEKPFTCQLCEKKFAHKYNLKRHLIVHSNEKPYSCELCGKAFNDLSSRNSHRKTHISKSKYFLVV